MVSGTSISGSKSGGARTWRRATTVTVHHQHSRDYRAHGAPDGIRRHRDQNAGLGSLSSRGWTRLELRAVLAMLDAVAELTRVTAAG